MKSAAVVESSPGTKAVTGVHAPVSGWWRPEDDPYPFRYIQKGDLMPGLDGKAATWVLEYPLSPSRLMNLVRLGLPALTVNVEHSKRNPFAKTGPDSGTESIGSSRKQRHGKDDFDVSCFQESERPPHPSNLHYIQNSPGVPTVLPATEERRTMQIYPYRKWNLLIGAPVEIWKDGILVRSGVVEEAMPDASALWIRADGPRGRQLYLAAEGYEVMIEPHLLDGDLRYRMTDSQLQ